MKIEYDAMTDTDVASQPEDSARYEFLLGSTADGVLVLDDERCVVQMNPAAAAMLGVTVDTIIGQTVKTIFNKNQALMNLCLRAGRQQLDVRLPRQRIAQGIAEDVARERIVLLQDVTEKRNIEQRREMLSKAIAHDLRNPIAAIGGFADLVGRFGELNSQQERYLTRIKQTSTKLHELVTSLVDLAWIEAGMPLAHVQVQLDEIIQKAIRANMSLAHKHNIGVAVSLQTPLPTIMGDPDRLQMVIRNLLNNAVIYSEPESNVAIHGWGDTHEIYCSVADRGMGIDDSELELIFDRMYRSRDERVRDIPGGGLGLTVARTIIKRHGGDVWASSNLDKGSTFTFVLPVVGA